MSVSSSWLSSLGRGDTNQEQLFESNPSMKHVTIHNISASLFYHSYSFKKKLPRSHSDFFVTALLFRLIFSSFSGTWNKELLLPLKTMIDMATALNKARSPNLCYYLFLDKHITKKEPSANLSVSDGGVSGMQLTIPQWS